MPFERRGISLSADQQQYLERLTKTHPTAEDLVLSLQNPWSPAYKRWMDIIIANADFNLMLEQMVEIWVTQAIQATKEEKDQLYREIMAIELSQKDKNQLDTKPLLFDRLASTLNDPVFLRKELVTKARHIGQLTSHYQDLNTHREKIEKHIAENTQAWETLSKHEAKNYLDRLQKENMGFQRADGISINVNNEEGMRFVEDIFTSKTPTHLIEKLLNSNLRSENKLAGWKGPQWEGEKLVVPPPPPFAPPQFKKENSENLAKMDCVMCELGLVIKLGAEKGSEGILKAVHENKRQRQELAATFLSSLDEKTKLIENSFNYVEEKITNGIQLNAIKTKLNAEERQFEVLKDRLTKLTGEVFQLQEHQSPRFTK